MKILEIQKKFKSKKNSDPHFYNGLVAGIDTC